ncbi:hypothetical protein BVRB_5g099110 [Beta vulgaris subsp. vulgaris]|nr:hypothetical protein BVRB_5g099110 [Beta vulgaris subsp. vulgaris]
MSSSSLFFSHDIKILRGNPRVQNDVVTKGQFLQKGSNIRP